MAEQHGFFEELKRRHVWRVAVAYAIASWLIVQIATQVFPVFHMPDWTEQIVVILVVIGFPVVVVLAWVYEITPEGVRRTAPADSPEARAEHATRQIGRKLNTLIIAVLAIAVALLGWRLLVLRHGESSQVRSPAVAQRTAGQPVPGSAVATAAAGPHAASTTTGAAKAAATPAAFKPPAASIVVLPFANLSGDPKQAYFSNGITEELTDALGQNTGLTVIAWDTASRFSTSQQSPAEIGKALNVAHILDGSIEQEGEAVRVSAELVSTVSGRQLWSAHYDDSFRNIFVVQDKITAAIAGELNVKLATLEPAPTTSPEAHELYLKGLAALSRFTAADTRAAQDDFRQALKRDPNYADAWAALASSFVILPEVSTLPVAEALPKIRAAAEKAFALDPHNINALVELGAVESDEKRNAQAMTTYKKALALDPNNAAAHNDYSLLLPPRQSLVQIREAVRLNPDSALFQQNLAYIYQYLGDWSDELTAAHAVVRLSPHNIVGAFLLAFAYTQLNRGDEAMRAFDLVQPDNPLDKQLVDAGRLTYQALLESARRPKALAALDQLREARLSPGSGYGLLQFYLALGENSTAIRLLPDFCAAGPAYCNDLDVNPIYIPLYGDARFEKLSKQYSTITPASASSR